MSEKLKPIDSNIREVAAKKALLYVFCDFDIDNVFTSDGAKPESYFDLYSKLMSNFNSDFYDIYDNDKAKIGDEDYRVYPIEDFYDSPLAHLEAFFDIIRDAISEFDF